MAEVRPTTLKKLLGPTMRNYQLKPCAVCGEDLANHRVFICRGSYKDPNAIFLCGNHGVNEEVKVVKEEVVKKGKVVGTPELFKRK